MHTEVRCPPVGDLEGLFHDDIVSQKIFPSSITNDRIKKETVGAEHINNHGMTFSLNHEPLNILKPDRFL
jgi:hypothetical protein